MARTSGSGMPDQGRPLKRALRPLLIGVIGSMLWVICYSGFRIATCTSLNFRTLLDGKPLFNDVIVKVDNQPFKPGQRVRVGKRSLVIESSESEAFEKTIFVGLSDINLGDVSLKRAT